MDRDKILDHLAFVALSQKQLIEKIAKDSMDVHKTSRVDVAALVADLVLEYGGRLGGLTQTRLVSKVMRKIESVQGKIRNDYWALVAANMRQESGSA